MLRTRSYHLVLLHELQQTVSKTVVGTPDLTDTNSQSLETENRNLLLVGDMLYSRMRMCVPDVTAYEFMDCKEQKRRKLTVFMISMGVKCLIQADFAIASR